MITECLKYAILYTIMQYSVAYIIHKIFPPRNFKIENIIPSIKLSLPNIFFLSIFEHLIINDYIKIFKLYRDINQYGISWLIFSTILFIITSELSLWIMHYTLHKPLLYKYIHSDDHQFIYPSAFDYAALHPIE